jgi:hypothetical protein
VDAKPVEAEYLDFLAKVEVRFYVKLNRLIDKKYEQYK